MVLYLLTIITRDFRCLPTSFPGLTIETLGTRLLVGHEKNDHGYDATQCLKTCSKMHDNFRVFYDCRGVVISMIYRTRFMS